ncbi:MAG: cobalamin biosynthesis protein CobD [Nitrospirales bacterium]|nr:cobalamin biosynthesis protein CobD [Nitrospirales bacterium]
MIGLKVLAACGLDAVLGDPRWLPHPVRLIGLLIQWYEYLAIRCCRGRVGQYIVGVILALGLPTLCYASAQWVIHIAGQFHDHIGSIVWILLGYTTLAARDLFDHAIRVYHALQAGALGEAQAAVSYIVGRDTENLSEPEVVRATIETVAESTSDGIIAPLFYLAVGGPPLALAYKAINTLDSMIGHRSIKYRYFGWASARFDDVLNWVPARMTGVLFVLASSLWLKSGAHAWRIFLRDGSKHSSPNSGWPEAAMAGGLHVQLGGTNFYNGTRLDYQLMGDDCHPLMPRQILHAVQLMIVASSLAGSLFVGILCL